MAWFCDISRHWASLISINFACWMLTPVPLLHWYLLNELIVTYLLMQYDRRSCFQPLTVLRSGGTPSRTCHRLYPWNWRSCSWPSCTGNVARTRHVSSRCILRRVQWLVRPCTPTTSGTWDLCWPLLCLKWPTQRMPVPNLDPEDMPVDGWGLGMTLRQCWVTGSWL